MHKIIEDTVEVQAEEIPENDKLAKAKQLWLNHHTLEKMEEPKDSEDVQQDYVWKVDKSTAITIVAETASYMFNGNKVTGACNNGRLTDVQTCDDFWWIDVWLLSNSNIQRINLSREIGC